MSTATRYGSFLLLLIGLNGTSVMAQGRVVLNDGGWLRIDGGAWLVVEEPTPAGIGTSGSGGNIRSEGEFNRIRWQIRNNVGTYVVPFTTASGVRTPFSFEVVGAGSNEATASICFSTYNYGTLGGTNWDNDGYRPTDVTHMHNYFTGAPSNNSDQVVDRFWIVDAGVASYGYGTRPSVRLGFTYDPGAATGDVRTGNTITSTSPLAAQRFNPPLDAWGDVLFASTFALGPVNTVTNVNVGPSDLFRSWTLSNVAQPLPVRLVGFAAECTEARVQLTWTTASESGSSHFLIWRSSDQEAEQMIGTVPAAGHSNGIRSYVSMDNDAPAGNLYYRLEGVDVDGSSQLSDQVTTYCGHVDTPSFTGWYADGALFVDHHLPEGGHSSWELYNAAGQVVATWPVMELHPGEHRTRLPLRGVSTGLYTLRAGNRDLGSAVRLAIP